MQNAASETFQVHQNKPETEFLWLFPLPCYLISSGLRNIYIIYSYLNNITATMPVASNKIALLK